MDSPSAFRSTFGAAGMRSRTAKRAAAQAVCRIYEAAARNCQFAKLAVWASQSADTEMADLPWMDDPGTALASVPERRPRRQSLSAGHRRAGTDGRADAGSGGALWSRERLRHQRVRIQGDVAVLRAQARDAHVRARDHRRRHRPDQFRRPVRSARINQYGLRRAPSDLERRRPAGGSGRMPRFTRNSLRRWACHAGASPPPP
jgi:hypothetical protein